MTANWKHGYYADSGYTYGYYAETSPMRMAWAAMIQGHRSPTRAFRYLDAGCGQGLNLILLAAAHPDAEFVGIDFLPEHIAHARALAQQCGLTNVTFIEGDFVQLSQQPEALGSFDYAVCHGITTWIAPAVKAALFRLIGQVLAPGGVFYNSYNTYPGWLSAVPFQHLVLLEQRSKTGQLALGAAKTAMQRIAGSAPVMFNALPSLPSRLKNMDSQDPAYLVQEYNNNHWQPVFVSQMMDDMAAVKLSYLGTATLPEANDLALAADVRDLLGQQTVAPVREQLRDYALNQSFRRDLYVKGQQKPWPGALESLTRNFRVVANPTAARPEAGRAFPIKAGSIELAGEPKVYGDLIDRIAQHPRGVSVGELFDGSSDEQTRNGLIFVLSMLLHGGWILPAQEPNAQRQATSVNSAISAAITEGAPYRFISAPLSGGAVGVSDVDAFLVHATLMGVPTGQLGQALEAGMQKRGRRFTKDGQAISDAADHARMIDVAVHEFLEVKKPFWAAMGAI